MFNASFALELAYIAVEEALRLKASYVDARYEGIWREVVMVEDGRLSIAESGTERGLGVRVLVGGAWGFAAISEPNRHDVAVGVRRAVELARAAAILQSSPVRLAAQEPQRGMFRTAFRRDPMSVSLEEKVAFLMRIDEALRAPSKIAFAASRFQGGRRRVVYVSSEGSEVEQDLVLGGIGFRAGAADRGDLQTRTFFGEGGLLLGQGWELTEELPLVERAEELALDAIELLAAPPCPEGPTRVILEGSQMAEQVVRSLGPLVELDRVVGLGDVGHGGTFLRAGDLGARRLGSEHLSLHSDARQAGGAGTYGFDDEGVSAERIELVAEGRIAGYLSSRETAARVGLERSQGTMRATSWDEPPKVRAGNLLLQPGKGGDLEALVADTDRGLLLDGPRTFSTDAHGRTFVATCESGWMIEGGRRVRRVKNPSYRGGTERFWRSCDAIADESEWRLYGSTLPSGCCATPVGLGVSPGRFLDVEVGTRAPRLVAVSARGPLPIARSPGRAPARAPGRTPRVSSVSGVKGSRSRGRALAGAGGQIPKSDVK